MARSWLTDTVQRMLRKRLFVALGAALVLMSSCSSSPTPSDISPNGKVNVPVVDRTPNRILVVGNSIAYQVGTSVQAALAASGVEVKNEAAPEIAVWGEKSPLMDTKAEYSRFIKDFDPDIVLVTTVFAHPQHDCGPEGVKLNDCQRAAVYESSKFLGTDLVDTLSAGGAKVVWMRYPYPGPFYEQRGATAREIGEIQDNAVIELSSSDKRLYVLDYRRTVNAPGEDFTLWLPVEGGFRQSRAFDGLHLCQYGAELVADQIVPLLDPAFDTTDVSWKDGPWRNDPIFSLRVFNGDPQCIDDVVAAPIPSPLEKP